MAVAKAFMVTSMPFILAEAVTGVTSFVTGELRIPPMIGIGTAVDSVILAVGLAVATFMIIRSRQRPRATV